MISKRKCMVPIQGRTILGERIRLTAVSLHFKLMKGTSRGDTVEVQADTSVGLAAFLPWRSLPSDRVSEIREER